MLLAPSVSTGPWTPELVWGTGFIQAYSQYLAYLSVEQYVYILNIDGVFIAVIF